MKKLLLIVVLLVGCVSTHKFHMNTVHDPIENVYIHKATDIEVENDIPTANIFFNPRVIVSSDTMKFFITVVYEARDWMFMRSGESLVLIIDGIKTKLYSPKGSLGSRHVGRRPSIWASGGAEVTSWEESVYITSLSLLTSIANSKSIIGRIYGDNMSPNLTFTKESIGQFKEFVEYFASVSLLPAP